MAEQERLGEHTEEILASLPAEMQAEVLDVAENDLVTIETAINIVIQRNSEAAIAERGQNHGP